MYVLICYGRRRLSLVAFLFIISPVAEKRTLRAGMAVFRVAEEST